MGSKATERDFFNGLLRVAAVSDLDIALENGKIKAYRAKVKISFKYEAGK